MPRARGDCSEEECLWLRGGGGEEERKQLEVMKRCDLIERKKKRRGEERGETGTE